MALFTDYWLLDFFVIINSCVAGLYIYLRLTYTYWDKRGILCLKPKFPFGNLGETMTLKKTMSETYADIYRNIKGHRFVGIFHLHLPTLVVRDPELVKALLLKDFSHFHDRGINFVERVDPLSAHLFMLSGSRWRNLRNKLTSTFTSGKMKMMFQSLVGCGHQLEDYLQGHATSGLDFEVKDVMARFTTDVIASCAFGIQCNCLKNPDAEFRKWGMKCFEPTTESNVRNFVIFCLPSIARFLELPMIPKDVTKFFRTMVRETVEHREKNGINCNDFMQLLIQLKNYRGNDNETDVCEYLTLDDVAAQAFGFYFAGFETSSTTMTFCLYELALNPHIQERLYDEIDVTMNKHDGIITYEAIQEMSYLDQVMSETLRKYPPIPLLNRECTKTFTIPDSDAVIEEGTKIVIPVLGIHRDPQHYPDPDKFDPQRFSEEEKRNRHHFSYLPFGEGPRICMGMRFGLMQTKVGISMLLSRYEFMVCEKTPIPLYLDPKLFFLTALNGTWLKIRKRKEKI